MEEARPRAVVAERNLPVLAVDEDRLRVDELARARRGIPYVTDGQLSLEAR